MCGRSKTRLDMSKHYNECHEIFAQFCLVSFYCYITSLLRVSLMCLITSPWFAWLYLRLGPFTRYSKLQVAHAPGMPRTFPPPPLVNDTGLHHGTCGHAGAVLHARIAKPRFPLKAMARKTFLAFPVHAQPAILRIWLDALDCESCVFPEFVV